MRTQVAIIGGGPAGLLLSACLSGSGVDNVVLERHPRSYVLARVRAGILESEAVELIRRVGVSDRLDAEGAIHDGVWVTWGSEGRVRIRLQELAGRSMVAYGQSLLTEDLYLAHDRRGSTLVEEALDVELHDLTSASPFVTFTKDGSRERLDCDFIAGCDGFHGVSRASIPAEALTTYEQVYPFGWLGILVETPPLPELVYAGHDRGFALCSTRNSSLGRYYVQCRLEDSIEDWPDDRFWEELLARIPGDIARQIETGPSVEKSIAPLRSFVAEPMTFGRLYLAGDAAHIVPPTGAKGLNLAISDVHYLSQALASFYRDGSSAALEGYSATALRRVWGAERFSWWMTTMLHRFSGDAEFQRRLRRNELAYLGGSVALQTSLAEQYVGLPY